MSEFVSAFIGTRAESDPATAHKICNSRANQLRFGPPRPCERIRSVTPRRSDLIGGKQAHRSTSFGKPEGRPQCSRSKNAPFASSSSAIARITIDQSNARHGDRGQRNRWKPGRESDDRVVEAASALGVSARSARQLDRSFLSRLRIRSTAARSAGRSSEARTAAYLSRSRARATCSFVAARRPFSISVITTPARTTACL